MVDNIEKKWWVDIKKIGGKIEKKMAGLYRKKGYEAIQSILQYSTIKS